MAKYIKGNSVANATSYELFEKANGDYTPLKTESVINFDLSTLGLATGEHVLVVKAHASGYESSDYSNEVTYTVASSGGGSNEPVTVDTSTMNFNSTYFLSGVDGSLITSSGDFKKVSDYVEIPSGMSITSYYSITHNNGTNAYCAFYDANKTFISSVMPNTDTDTEATNGWLYTETPPTIPSGAKYIRVAGNTALGKKTASVLVFG